MLFEIGIFRKFLESHKLLIFGIHHIANFLNFQNWAFFWIFQIDNFYNFPNWNFLEFSKLNFFLIFQIVNFSNLPNLKFLKLSKLKKSKFGSKNLQFWNYSFIRYSALFAILPILILALWYKSISTIQLLIFHFIF